MQPSSVVTDDGRNLTVTMATQTDDCVQQQRDESLSHLDSSSSELDLTDLDLGDDDVYGDSDFDDFNFESEVRCLRPTIGRSLYGDVMKTSSSQQRKDRKDSGIGQSDDSWSVNDDELSQSVALEFDDVTKDLVFSPLCSSSFLIDESAFHHQMAHADNFRYCDSAVATAADAASGDVTPPEIASLRRRLVPRMGIRVGQQWHQQQNSPTLGLRGLDGWQRISRLRNQSLAEAEGKVSPRTAAASENRSEVEIVSSNPNRCDSDVITSGSSATSGSVSMQWVVHIRSDGSRHITRRPAVAPGAGRRHRSSSSRRHCRKSSQRQSAAADVITSMWRRNVLKQVSRHVWDGFTTVDELLVLGHTNSQVSAADCDVDGLMNCCRVLAVTQV
jgi:hypothetical protein